MLALGGGSAGGGGGAPAGKERETQCVVRRAPGMGPGWRHVRLGHVPPRCERRCHRRHRGMLMSVHLTGGSLPDVENGGCRGPPCRDLLPAVEVRRIPQEYRILAQPVQERNTAKAPERRGTVQWLRARPDPLWDLFPQHELDDLREAGASGRPRNGARPLGRDGRKPQGLQSKWELRLDGRDGSWVNTEKPVNGDLVCRNRTRVQALSSSTTSGDGTTGGSLLREVQARRRAPSEMSVCVCTLAAVRPPSSNGDSCAVTIGSAFGRIPEIKANPSLVTGATPTAEEITRDDRQRRSIQAWGPCGP